MAIGYRPLPLAGDTVDDLTANDVASASSVGTPVIGQVHVLNAADVASASSVSAPVLGQIHALLAADVASASSVSTPAIALVVPILAEDVASASSVSTPVIGQVHVILAADVASASSVTAPVLGQVHALLANDVASASGVSAPVLAEESGTNALLAEDVASASSVSVPVLGQVHALTANDVESASSVTAPVLGGDAVPIPVTTGMELGWALVARERRHREREKADKTAALARIRRQARRKVIEEVDDRGLLERLSPIGLKAQLTSLIGEAITEVAPAIITAQMRYEMMISIRAEIMRRQADEDDAEAMLLSA
jgi:hypothetical protein